VTFGGGDLAEVLKSLGSDGVGAVTPSSMSPKQRSWASTEKGRNVAATGGELLASWPSEFFMSWIRGKTTARKAYSFVFAKTASALSKRRFVTCLVSSVLSKCAWI